MTHFSRSCALSLLLTHCLVKLHFGEDLLIRSFTRLPFSLTLSLASNKWVFDSTLGGFYVLPHPGAPTQSRCGARRPSRRLSFRRMDAPLNKEGWSCVFRSISRSYALSLVLARCLIKIQFVFLNLLICSFAHSHFPWRPTRGQTSHHSTQTASLGVSPYASLPSTHRDGLPALVSKFH